jgi:hypothetical protein
VRWPSMQIAACRLARKVAIQLIIGRESLRGLSHLCEEVVVIDEVEVTFNVKC